MTRGDVPPRGDREGARQWILRADEATAHFYKLGLLPSDPQMLEVALITGELRATISYANGEKVADPDLEVDAAAVDGHLLQVGKRAWARIVVG